MTGGEIAIYAALAGAATTAYATYEQGKAQEQTARANAEFNAAVARDEAARKAAVATAEADKRRRDAIRLRGIQETKYAKAGVTTEGTPISVMIQSAADEELETLRMTQNLDIDAARSLSQASVYDYQGATASKYRRAGQIAAGSSLLEGTARAAYMHEQLN